MPLQIQSIVSVKIVTTLGLCLGISDYEQAGGTLASNNVFPCHNIILFFIFHNFVVCRISEDGVKRNGA